LEVGSPSLDGGVAECVGDEFGVGDGADSAVGSGVVGLEGAGEEVDGGCRVALSAWVEAVVGEVGGGDAVEVLLGMSAAEVGA
jgi:hypothetical protein